MTRIAAVGILVLLITSCKEDLKSKDGPAVASDVVLNSVCYHLSEEQLLRIKIGEKSVAAKSMSVLGEASSIVEAHRLQVLSEEHGVCDTTSGHSVPCINYEFFEEVEDFITNDIFHFEREFLVPAVEPEGALMQKLYEATYEKRQSDEGNEAMDSTIDQEVCYLTEDLYASVGIRMTFHNFQMKEVEVNPPSAVAARPNCGGVKNCKMKVKQVEFDQQFLGSDGSKMRRHYLFQVSPSVPYSSRYLKRCITHSIPQHVDQNGNGQIDEGEIRIVPIHECRDVVDFEFGT